MNPVKTLTDPRTYRAGLFLLSGVVLGTLEFCLLLAGWIALPLLALTPLSVPVLVAYRWCVRRLALAEASLARELLASRLSVPEPARNPGGYWRAGQSALADGAFWRQQAYLLYRATVGWSLGVAWASLIGGAVYLIFLPAYYGPTNTEIVTRHIDSLGEAFAVVPLGLVVLLVTVWLTPFLGRMSGALAVRLLGRPAAPTKPAAHRHRRALLVHAAAYGLVNVVLVVIWASTTRAYFWPEWTLISLAVPLAIHAWVELVESKPGLWRGRGVTKALALHAGVTTTLSVFLVLVWAVTTRGYFWPFWSILAFLLLLGGHALVDHRRGGERIRQLEESRAGAVDQQETELRRIERDLHDGAQARLVALGMSLGLAEQRLAEDPEGARQLLLEARTGIGEALQELRDLARGIHPPILTDRGLAAAISALADRSPLTVDVDADVPERPAPAVETAAYFVAAEALANAAKHANPSAVHVRIGRHADVLSVAVEDDGVGGADPTGRGLHGLRQRVEALDGTLTVESPVGGPTIVTAELPCGS